MIRHLVNCLLYFLPPTRLFMLRRALWRLAGVDLAARVSVCGRGWIYGRGTVRIGSGTWLSPGVIIHSHIDAPVMIGADCDIGPGAEFVTGSHSIGGPDRRAGAGTAATIVVEPGCWVGARALLLGGVTVGAGSIIAAGAVVTRSVPSGVLVAGVPATVRKRLDG